MKKLLVMLMVLTMLLPMCLLPAGAEEVKVEPFYGLGWHELDTEKYPYLDGLVWTWFSVKDDRVTFGMDGAGTDVDKVVEQVKSEMESRPAGTRYLHIFRPAKALAAGVENKIYMDNAVEQMRVLLDQFLEKYSAAGGLLEGIILDVEYQGIGAWYIYLDAYKNDPLLYKKIVDDPRYATEIRPLLVEHGFTFYKNVTDQTPEIYSLVRNVGAEYANCERIWDTVIRIHLNRYANKWCFEPLQKYFPNATLSDYQSTDDAAWEKGVDNSGADLSVGGNNMKVGNVSNYNFYASRPNSNFYQSSGTAVYKNPVTYNDAVYEASAFNMFLFDANLAKRIYASTDTKKVSFWLARYDYAPNKEGTLSCTPYYAEQILHLGMMDPEPFLVFMAKEHFDTDQQYDESSRVINDLMAELTRVAGYSDRKPIEIPQTWNSEFVLSGMYANGRNLWRITPNTDEVALADFQVEGENPTFYVKGQKVTFPQGKIIETGEVSIVGTCGYWVETPANVTPIVTNDADRFVKFPAYAEDFNSYKSGDELNTNKVKYKGTWVAEPIGGSPYFTGKNGEIALAFSGTGTIKNTLLPQNITAGDGWAREQRWSVTVTLPENLTGAGELTLLRFVADGQTKADSGIKLVGGKIYYDRNGESTLLQGLDLSYGGKYIFQRVLHCTQPGAYTCDYYILDENGKTLGGARNVPIVSFTPPVTTIRIEYKKLPRKVLLDDYILCAVGITTDFTLYDRATGLQLADTRQTYRTDVTYRLSWMHGATQEGNVSLKAAFYEGDTLKETKLLKTILVAPGCDGVETGVVEVPAGQSVKVYMETDFPEDLPSAEEILPPSQPAIPDPPAATTPGATAPTQPAGTEPATTAATAPDAEQPAQRNNTGLIVLVVLAVAALGAAGFLLIKKSRK